MRVALSVDMEGVSRIIDPFEILAFDHAYWNTGRDRMIADTVAAANGLLAGGADEVIVLDNHGSGNPVNVPQEALPSGARLETWNVFDLRGHGVDAMLQVGYHARAGVDAFVSHTYVPGLRLRLDGELIGESHGRAWAAGVPLLGIVGNEQHARTLGSLDGAAYLVVQHTDDRRTATPAFADGEIADAIETFARDAIRAGGTDVEPPAAALLEASFPTDDEQAAVMAAAGWTRTSDTAFSAELAQWPDARDLIAAAMNAALLPWLGYFTAFDLTTREAVDAVAADPILVDARATFADWLAGPNPDWY